MLTGKTITDCLINGIKNNVGAEVTITPQNYLFCCMRLNSKDCTEEEFYDYYIKPMLQSIKQGATCPLEDCTFDITVINYAQPLIVVKCFEPIAV